MVVRTLGLIIVRRVLDLLGLGPTPDADAVEIVVLRHQLGASPSGAPAPVHAKRIEWCWSVLAKLLSRQPQLAEVIAGVHAGHDGTYSAPRVAAPLRRQGRAVNRNPASG